MWREPLVHFLALGALLFVVHRVVVGAPPSEYVDREDAPVEQIRQEWFAAKGVFPNEEQEAALVDEWLDEEVLYRQAIELGLDRNDKIIRRQLVQRMRFLLEDMHWVEPPTDEQLRAWLEAQPERFAEPARLSFTHRFFSRAKHGGELAAVARSALNALREDPSAVVEDDPFFRGNDFDSVTPAEIARAFGTGFAEGVADLPLDRWAGPVKSSYGLHLAYVRSRTAPTAPSLAAVRDEVEKDWLQAERERRNDEALAKLRARYTREDSK